jgi:four helix bundle protein
MGIVLEEVDESKYWMEILVDGSLMKKQQLEALIQEATEITAMVIASINTARRAKP